MMCVLIEILFRVYFLIMSFFIFMFRQGVDVQNSTCSNHETSAFETDILAFHIYFNKLSTSAINNPKTAVSDSSSLIRATASIVVTTIASRIG